MNNVKNMTTEELQRHLLLRQLAPKTNHVLHAILSICTGGLWLTVWLLVIASQRLEARKFLAAAEGKTSLPNKYLDWLGKAVVALLVLFVGLPMVYGVIAGVLRMVV